MSHNDEINTTVSLLERAKRIALPVGVSVRDDITYHLIHDELIDEAIRHLHKISRHALECTHAKSEISMLSEDERTINTNSCNSLHLHSSFELLSVNQHVIAKEVIARTFDSHLSNLREKLHDTQIECEYWRAIAEGKKMSPRVKETKREHNNSLATNELWSKNLCNSCTWWCENAWQHVNDTHTAKLEVFMCSVIEQLYKLFSCQASTLVTCTQEKQEKEKLCQCVSTENVDLNNIEIVDVRQNKLQEWEQEEVQEAQKYSAKRVKTGTHLTKHISTTFSDNGTNNSKRKTVSSKQRNLAIANTASLEVPYKLNVFKSPLYQLGKVKLLPRTQSHYEREERHYELFVNSLL